jgi:enoyl-CoA hydratase
VSPGAKVRYERNRATAVLTIARREVRNAVDEETSRLLLEGLRRFEADDEARVMVLTGDGPEAFCAGADLKAVASALELPEEEARQRLLDLNRPEGPLGISRVTPSKPTIAAISGWCLAGGLELALWCDLRIATEDAKLGFPERRWGVPLIDGGTQRLPRIVGMGRALDMILSGRIVESGEALAMGLVNEVVGAGEHLERALEIAEALGRFPQETMLSDRRAAIEGSGLPLEEGLELEAKLGLESVPVGVKGAARFAAGEGRHGEGAGV